MALGLGLVLSLRLRLCLVLCGFVQLTRHLMSSLSNGLERKLDRGLGKRVGKEKGGRLGIGSRVRLWRDADFDMGLDIERLELDNLVWCLRDTKTRQRERYIVEGIGIVTHAAWRLAGMHPGAGGHSWRVLIGYSQLQQRWRWKRVHACMVSLYHTLIIG